MLTQLSNQVLVGVRQTSLQTTGELTQRGLDELGGRNDALDLEMERKGRRGEQGGEGG